METIKNGSQQELKKFSFSKENIYGVALLWSFGLFSALSYYILLRRGYYNLYIANKAFAGTAAIMLGLVVLIGPASRMFDRFDGTVRYRKVLGIAAFFLAALHSLVSYFSLPDYFPQARFYGSGWYPFLFGLSSVVILALLAAISNRLIQGWLGGKLWWRLQNWAVRLAFAGLAAHVFVMKYASWLAWYKNGGGKELAMPQWPGAGLLVGWFLALVVAVRVSELLGQKFGRVVWYTGWILLPVIYVFTFWQGSRVV